jgi:hypothetical protein
MAYSEQVLHGPYTFRYTGIMDWKRIYRECMSFFLRIVAENEHFTEKLYQHKPTKIDVRWEAFHNYDAYYQIHYTVSFRIVKPKTVWVQQPDGTKKEMIEGAMRVWIEFGWNEDYEVENPGGDIGMFQSNWLKAIYRKLTWRERWDLVDDIAMFQATDFIELLVKLTKADTGGYASVWEPG